MSRLSHFFLVRFGARAGWLRVMACLCVDFAAGILSSPVELQLRIFSIHGGPVRIAWIVSRVGL